MNFNSFKFFAFFIVVYFLYLSLKQKQQNRLLLIASYFFYGCWDWRFLGLIFISTVTDFFCGLKIDQYQEKQKRRQYLILSILVNLSILGFFKYFNFFLENLTVLFSWFGITLDHPTWHVILPVGISFYTFQTMSYTIDVYRRKIKPTTDFFDYALYVSFFPQLVAGPIERARNLLPQILKPRILSPERLKEGVLLIYWGLFKKIFIADNIGTLLAYFGDPVSANGAVGDGGLVLASMYAYMFQLYCDFSAYSDIARGTAKMMGFDIMINFRSPFFAQNIQDTWNRWHISLTSWIRDYLYFPLATVKIGKKYLNPMMAVIITFLIMGLWHGAAWNYVLWGGYNGVILVLYAIFVRKTRRFRRPKPRFLQNIIRFLSILITFHVASFGIILFRANSLQQISHWIYHLFASFSMTAEATELMSRVFVYSLPLLIVDLFLYKNNDNILAFSKYPTLVKYGFLYLVGFLMVVYHAKASNFIYFQF